jgi:type I restriction enzyme S subunit
MFLLREFNQWLNARYVLYELRSPLMIQQIESLKSGTAQPQLPIREFREFKFLFPCKEEQQAIVREIESRLSVADALEKTIEKSLKKAELLRQSILKKAFEGELTRKWREEHPELITGENSAEALLERIKAEKERNTSKSNRKKRTRKTANTR